MVKWIVFVALVVGATGPLAAAEWLELRNFKLFDGTGSEPREVHRLVVKDGEIVAIDEADDEQRPAPGEAVTIIDLDGAFMMPGLIDTHVHLANWPMARHELVNRLSWALDHGVTSLRDLGGDARVLAEIRRAAELGELDAPRIRIGAIFGGQSMFNHPALAQASPGMAPGQAPWLREVSGEGDVSLMVAMARGAGVDALKIYGNLGVTRVEELVAEAQQQGMMAWAHATVFPASPQDLISVGVQSLSHAPYLIWAGVESLPDDYGYRTKGPWDDIPPDHPGILDLLDEMAERGVVLDATLAMYRDMTRYRPAEGIEWAMQAFEWGVTVTRLAHERGVPVSVGTDAFFPPTLFEPPNTHVEIRALVKDVGLSPDQALVAATRNGARAAGLDELVGTVEVGKRADLVVLGSDPLSDIHATTDIDWVIFDGRIHRRPER